MGSITPKHLMEFIKNSKCFDSLLGKLKIVSVGQGNCVAELKVDEGHTNHLGTLHGGFSATLVDQISSYALLSHAKGAVPSVSVDMNMTYIKAAQIGETIKIEANTIRAGRTLAFLHVLIKNNSGEVLVQGSHTKLLMNKSQ